VSNPVVRITGALQESSATALGSRPEVLDKKLLMAAWLLQLL
jgi:hypothetical protein